MGRWVKLERERRQAAEQGRPDPHEMEAEITALRRRVCEREKENEFWEKLAPSSRLGTKHQRFELMDARKASYSITLMGKVLGVTCAGYFPWKNRAPSGASAHW